MAFVLTDRSRVRLLSSEVRTLPRDAQYAAEVAYFTRLRYFDAFLFAAGFWNKSMILLYTQDGRFEETVSRYD